MISVTVRRIDRQRYYTREHAARLAGVSRRTIDRWTAAGRLTRLRIGVRQTAISGAELADLLAPRD